MFLSLQILQLADASATKTEEFKLLDPSTVGDSRATS
jgi:hypothetical protein